MTLFVLVLIQLLFGALPVTAKISLQTASPLELIQARATGTFLFFAGWALFGGIPLRHMKRRDHIACLALAAVGASLNQFALFLGLRLTDAVVAAIAVPTIPLFTVVISTLAGRETLNPRKLALCALGFCGVGVLAIPDLMHGSEGISHLASPLGIALVVCSSLLSACFLVFSKPVAARTGSLPMLCVVYGYATLLNVALLGVESTGVLAAAGLNPTAGAPSALTAPVSLTERLLTAPPAFWFASVYVVLGSTAAANGLNVWALQRMQASTVGSFVFLQTLIGMALGVMVLGESISAFDTIAAAFLISALIGLFQLARREQSRSRSSYQ